MTEIGKSDFTERNPGSGDLTPVALKTWFSTRKSDIFKKGGGVEKGGGIRDFREFVKMRKKENGEFWKFGKSSKNRVFLEK